MSITADSASTSIRLALADKRKHRTLWGDAWVQFRRNRVAVYGLLLLLLIILAILLGPYIYRVDPRAINILESSAPPSASHPFGTDDLGRDISRAVCTAGAFLWL